MGPIWLWTLDRDRGSFAWGWEGSTQLVFSIHRPGLSSSEVPVAIWHFYESKTLCKRQFNFQFSGRLLSSRHNSFRCQKQLLSTASPTNSKRVNSPWHSWRRRTPVCLIDVQRLETGIAQSWFKIKFWKWQQFDETPFETFWIHIHIWDRNDLESNVTHIQN